ncbi:MAG: fumarylacetoacetate hydrolase family protein [Shimia sp.]
MLAFDTVPPIDLPVTGTDLRYPVRRLFCVGRNYAAHAAEMGGTVDRAAPWYFTKQAVHARPSGIVLPYPPGTADLHHEVELALMLGAELHAADATRAAAALWGGACALDMTRRDRQQEAKDTRRPWSLGKDFEGSAILGPVTRGFAPADQTIRLAVNGATRQGARLSDMVWSPAEIVAHLSRFYHLAPGDVILTGTPAGVAPVVPGDRLEAHIDGLAPLTLEIGQALRPW